MAGKHFEAHSEVANVGEIFHHPDYNAARLTGNYGSENETKKLFGSMLTEGWRMNGDGVIEVEKITQPWLEKAMGILTTKWEKLKADGKDALPALHVFETLRVHKGKLIQPKWMGISGNRRFSILDEVNLARYTAEPSQPLIAKVPVIERVFESEKDRLVAQMLENFGKMEGFARPTEKDMLLFGRLLLSKGGTQQDLRKAFTATTGQKVYGVLTLDARFPSVELVNRIIKLPEDDPRKLKYGPIPGAALPNLVLRSDKGELVKENAKRRTKGEPEFAPLTVELLEEFVTGTKNRGTNEAKMMDKDSIKTIAEQNQNVVVKTAFQSIINRNSDLLNPYIAHADAFNALDSLVKVAGPEMDLILKTLTAAPDLGIALKTVRSALKV